MQIEMTPMILNSIENKSLYNWIIDKKTAFRAQSEHMLVI